MRKKFKPFPDTEDLLWTECIRMNHDLCELKRKNGLISETKKDWLKANGYDWRSIKYQCFFCQQAKIDTDDFRGCICNQCPAVKVDQKFSCMALNYHFALDDGKFVNKLKELNQIRKESK